MPRIVAASRWPGTTTVSTRPLPEPLATAPYSLSLEDPTDVSATPRAEPTWLPVRSPGRIVLAGDHGRHRPPDGLGGSRDATDSPVRELSGRRRNPPGHPGSAFRDGRDQRRGLHPRPRPDARRPRGGPTEAT